MTASASAPLRSTIPARLDRLSWSPFHTRMVAGLGAAWILDGLQITISSSVTGVLSSPKTLDMTSAEIGLIASVYLIGEMVGALYFGRMSDRLGRKRLLIMTLLLYLLGTGAAAFVTGHHHRLAVVLLRHQIRGRHGYRRAVRRDQLRDRRDDALEVPRPGRHLDQRHLLGRRDHRLLRVADLPQRLRDQRGLAAGLPDGAGAGPRRHRRRPDPPGEPPLADDARPGRGGGARAREDRGRRPQVRRRADPGRRQPGDQPGPRGAVRLPGVPAPGVPRVSEAGDPGRDADDHPVLPLQRHLLHLRPGARELLRRERHQGADLRPGVLRGQPARAVAPRATVRHRRTEADDLRHLPALRWAAAGQRLAVRRRRPERDDPDPHVGGDLLLRLGRRQRGVPHGERDLADRDPSRGDRGVLRDRPDLRRAGSTVLRRPDRRRSEPHRHGVGLHHRRPDHDGRRAGRAPHRDQGRGTVAGDGDQAVDVGGHRGDPRSAMRRMADRGQGPRGT